MPLQDAATPIEWSRRLADQLASSVLIEVDTDVHAIYPGVSACAAALIDRYLLTGEAPPGAAQWRELVPAAKDLAIGQPMMVAMIPAR